MKDQDFIFDFRSILEIGPINSKEKHSNHELSAHPGVNAKGHTHIFLVSKKVPFLQIISEFHERFRGTFNRVIILLFLVKESNS